jgi:hypothetical protein
MATLAMFASAQGPLRNKTLRTHMNILAAIERTPLSQLMQNASWTISAIQSVHIMALAVVFTSAAAVDLRLLDVMGRDQPLQRMTARYFPAVGWGLLALFATGLLLMIAEPKRALLNPYFQIKMAAVVLVGALTWALGRAVSRHPERWIMPRRRGLSKGIAIVSLVLWVVIITAGRWIAYGP